MTTETNQTGEQQPQSNDGPWNMSFDKLMQAAGKAVDTAKASVISSMEPSAAPEPTSTKKPWEMAFDELKKFIPGATPKQEVSAPSTPVKEAPKGAYFTPEKDNKYASAVRNYYETQLKAESQLRHYDANGELIRSNKGAAGVSQVMPKTGDTPGYGVKPLQSETEDEYRRFGFDYMTAMNQKYKGDIRKALAAYNYGPGNVDKIITQARRAGANWETRLPKETRDYLTKIVGKA